MKRKLLFLNLLLFSAISASGCVMYNGIPQESEESSPIKLSLSTSSMSLIVGDGGKTFTVTVSSEEEEIKDNTVAIAISNSEVVELDSTSVSSGTPVRVKGLKEGSANLTITSNQDKSAKATLSISVSTGDGTFAVESVTVSNKAITLKVGETDKIEYSILPENATNKDVTFSSESEDYVTVDGAGNITAVKESLKDGDGNYVPTRVSVTSKDGGKSDYAEVIVEEDATLVDGNLYLIGGSTEFGSWTTPKKKYELIRNTGASSDKEYMVNFEAHKNDQFKVVKYHKDAALDWYDIDTNYSGDNYCANSCATVTDGNVQIEKDGKYTIYFDLGAVRDGHFYKYYVGLWLN